MLRPALWMLLASVFQFALGVVAHADDEAAFSAVSIKLDVSKRLSASPVTFNPGGRLTADGVTVRQLILAAYGLPPGSPRLAIGPDWTDFEKYVVQAVADDGVIPAGLSGAQLRDQMRPMLRGLLAERFKLVVRRDPKDMPAFTLTAAQTGVRLAKASVTEAECDARPAGDENECHRFAKCNQYEGCLGVAVTMADVAYQLEVWTDRPVVDQTGLTGLFSVRLSPFTRVNPSEPPAFIRALPPEMQPNLPAPGPGLLKVVERDLGLRLQTSRARIETLSIVSVERPTPN